MSSKEETRNNFPELVEAAIEGMENMKASNITILDLTELENSVCDFFLICEGTSNTQVKSICDSVEEEIRTSLSEKPWHIEGLENAEWVLMDYVNTVVHIFQGETRKFFDLESLWGDARVTVLENNF